MERLYKYLWGAFIVVILYAVSLTIIVNTQNKKMRAQEAALDSTQYVIGYYANSITELLHKIDSTEAKLFKYIHKDRHIYKDHLKQLNTNRNENIIKITKMDSTVIVKHFYKWLNDSTGQYLILDKSE